MENETATKPDTAPTETASTAPVATKQRKAKKAAARKSAKKPAAKKTRKPEMDPKKFAARAVRLYGAGKKVSEIAVALGYERGHGQNRVAKALIAAGFYKGKRAA
jgi:hypothetical protein